MPTEILVKYVHTDADIGCRPMLGIRGVKLAHCVGVEYDKVYAASIPLKDFDKASPVLRHHDPYPIKRYLDMLEDKSKKPATRVSPKASMLLRFAHDPDKFDEEQILRLEDQPVDGDAPEIEADPEPSEKPAKSKKRAAPPSVPGKAPKAARKPSPAAGTPEKRGRGRPTGSAGTGMIARLAAELKADPAHLRKACRASGMKAPYEDEKPIRAAWKKHGGKYRV